MFIYAKAKQENVHVQAALTALHFLYRVNMKILETLPMNVVVQDYCTKHLHTTLLATHSDCIDIHIIFQLGSSPVFK
jgi:hypothetical protein